MNLGYSRTLQKLGINTQWKRSTSLKVKKSAIKNQYSKMSRGLHSNSNAIAEAEKEVNDDFFRSGNGNSCGSTGFPIIAQ